MYKLDLKYVMFWKYFICFFTKYKEINILFVFVGKKASSTFIINTLSYFIIDNGKSTRYKKIKHNI